MAVPILVTVAFLLDLIVGDPPKIPHPVVLIGKFISVLEKYVYSPVKLWGLTGGAFMAISVVICVYCSTFGLLLLLKNIHPWLAVAVEIWLLSTTFAARGLARAAQAVLMPLRNNNLENAREMLGHIVGRDTCDMNSREITRGTVETVAENTVDGVIAPMFYAFLGGAPMAMAYKAVNTLDSMVGYKNDKYHYFGRFSARLDDLANYFPARIGGLLLLAAAAIKGKNIYNIVIVVLRDYRKHPSPNSGIPEAVVAGSLGVRLGGNNCYQGNWSLRPYIGNDDVPLQPGHISQTISLMYISSALFVALGVIIYYIYFSFVTP